jgi:hypothetical protein
VIIEFTIPGLPKRTNNSSSSWKARYAEARKWKRLVQETVVLNKLKPPRPFTKAKLTLIRASSLRPDSDGLVSAFKHVIDGLIEAGVLINDKYNNIGMPEYLWEQAPQKKGFITVKVEGIE